MAGDQSSSSCARTTVMSARTHARTRARKRAAGASAGRGRAGTSGRRGGAAVRGHLARAARSRRGFAAPRLGRSRGASSRLHAVPSTSRAGEVRARRARGAAASLGGDDARAGNGCGTGAKRRVMTVSGPDTCRSVGDEGSVKAGWTTAGPIKNRWRSTRRPGGSGRTSAGVRARWTTLAGSARFPPPSPTYSTRVRVRRAELGWQRRKLVLGALLASISAVALLRVGVRPTRASHRLAADDPWDYLDDHLPPDDSLTASASLASDRLFRLGRRRSRPISPARRTRPPLRDETRAAASWRHPRPQHGRPHHERRRRRRLRRHPALAVQAHRHRGGRRARRRRLRRHSRSHPAPGGFLPPVRSRRSHPETFVEGSAPPSGDRCATPRTSSVADAAPQLSCVRRTTRTASCSQIQGFAGFRNRAAAGSSRRRRRRACNGAYLVHNHGFRGYSSTRTSQYPRVFVSLQDAPESGPGLGSGVGGEENGERDSGGLADSTD